jgi:hypothetical protein
MTELDVTFKRAFGENVSHSVQLVTPSRGTVSTFGRQLSTSIAVPDENACLERATPMTQVGSRNV